MSIRGCVDHAVEMDRRESIDSFFTEIQRGALEVPSEQLGYFRKALMDFDESECKKRAEDVYLWFTALNRFEDREGRPLNSLMDTMKAYEERSSTFTESQRDHYVHSVNVFLLGMQIYMSSERFRNAFASTGDTTFENVHERFLYSWGHAALFHDVGYPVEIALNQAKAFTRTIAGIGASEGADRTDAGLLVHDFQLISRMEPAEWEGLDLFSVLSRRVSSRLGLDYGRVYETVSGFVDTMYNGCFIDHGFYSALILLRSMASSMQRARLPAHRFDFEVVDAAAAIMLHNFYRGVFTSPRYDYDCGPMDVRSFPLAYLLILCDELQDWNREKYGVRTMKSIHPDYSRVSMRGEVLTINYRTADCGVCGGFIEDKEVLLNHLLDIGSAFNGLRITCSCDRSADLLMASLEDRAGGEYPAPMLDNMIEIAKWIHHDYNEKRLIEYPDRSLEYPTWECLTQDLKYSNIMQAMDIPNKLRAIGYHIGREGEGSVVEEFTEEEILYMAILEHQRWMDERAANGWIWGPEKDVEKRISPHMVEWDKLSDEIKQYDIEAVENTIQWLDRVGLKVLRNE